MKENNKIVPIILIVIAIVLTAISYAILPDDVAIQFNTKGEARIVNKYSAVTIPLVISLLGAFMYWKNFYNDTAKQFVGVSIVGYAVFILIDVINLFFFKA